MTNSTTAALEWAAQVRRAATNTRGLKHTRREVGRTKAETMKVMAILKENKSI